MKLIYMPNSGKPIEKPPKPAIPPAVLVGGTGATAVAGLAAYNTWDTLMRYKWVIILAIILVILLIAFAWKTLKGGGDAEDKEEAPEEE